MLWTPQKGGWLKEHNLSLTGPTAPLGTSVTTGATSSTKGTPVELITSSAFDAYWVTILAAGLGSNAAATQGSMDLLIGASTESILIADLLCGYADGGVVQNSPKQWHFPLYVPAGSRIAVQAASAATSTAFGVGIILTGGWGTPPWRVGSKVTTYGMGTVPDGTSITPASGGTGTWTEITSSTTYDHFALFPSFQPTGDTTLNNHSFSVELGVGAATEELISNPYYYTTDSTERMSGPFAALPCFRDVPSGTRLVMRASCNAAPDGGYNAVIHAVT